MHEARPNPRRRGLITVALLLVASLGLITAATAFDDVPDNAHYAAAVDWGADQGIVAGRTPSEFEPGVRVTRGELMVMLWRLAGEPDADAPTFVDVDPTAFYATAIGWAQDVGITQGVTANTFEPDAAIDRAQLLTQIWNYACQPAEAAPHGFADVPAGAFYEAAIKWAVAEGIASGYSDTMFGPGDTASRADAITFIWRFAGMPAVGDPGDNRQSDMPGCIGVIDGDEGTAGFPGYTVTGNTQLIVSDGTATAGGLATFLATTNLMDNTTEPAEGLTIAVTPAIGTSAQGGAYEVFADGTFEYQPLAGFSGVDNFGYQVCDDNVTPACDSSTAYIQVNTPVWYVDEDTGDDATGDGGSDNAFATLSPLNGASGAGDPDAAGDTIYLVDPDDTTVTGPIELENQQTLLGEGVALMQGATTLRTAGDAPTLTSTADAVVLTSDNTIRGLDVAATGGGKGIVSTITNYGSLTIGDVASVTSTNGTALDIQGPGNADVTIGAVAATSGGTAVKIGNHAAGTSSFAFTTVTATGGGGSGHGVDIFGLDSPGNGATHTVDLGTVDVDRTGAGNHGVHVIGSLAGPIRVAGGTVASDASALYVQNADVDMTFLRIDSDGTADPTAPGIDLQNQHGSITVTGDAVNDGNGSGGLIENKTEDAVQVDAGESLTFFELDVSSTSMGYDLDDLSSGPHTIRGASITTGSVGVDLTDSAGTSQVVLDNLDIDGPGSTGRGIDALATATATLRVDVTDSDIDGVQIGIAGTSNAYLEATVTGNRIGQTTAIGGTGVRLRSSLPSGAPTLLALVDNNTITSNHASEPTVELGSATGTNATSNLQATVTNNTLANSGPGDELTAVNGFSTTQLCAHVEANNFNSGTAVFDNSASGTFQTKGTDAANIELLNTNTVTLTAIAPIAYGGPTFACALPTP